ncbi:MAG: cysteine desulfurase [Lachnospiraceae bacterium]|nr:cysteine desulfurase [Lachnospiraceae bacterium]
MEAYLDNSATTRVFPEVAELMTRLMLEDYGNPSSMHFKGVRAEQYVKHAKEQIAKVLKVNEKELIFTSGGTEADNLALTGAALANRRSGMHLITTKIEHPAVLKTMEYLEGQGFRVTYLPVDKTGRVRLEDLKKSMRQDTILVSVMHTNNEIGALQPIAEIGALIKKMNPRTLFHVDAVQGFGKFRIFPKKMYIDLLSVSGHKIHGPKGVGFLYAGEKVKLHPIVFGGGQQNGLRSGTENVPGIAGLGLACQKVYETLEEDSERMYRLREKLIEGVSDIGNIQINGCPGREGAPHVVSISFRGVRSEVLLHALEDRGICVSAGSACAAKHPRPSETLKAIGVERPLLESTLRFSLSLFTTEEEIVYTLHTLHEIVPVLRRYSRY